MPRLLLLRHGQSLWNRERRFTGWTDIDLSPQGREEARDAGRMMKKAGITVDVAYTSLLKRAIRTLWIVLDEMDLMKIPVTKSWRLNERNYGDFEGRSVDEVEELYGPEQVRQWRRGFFHRPPPLPEKEVARVGENRRIEPAVGSVPASESLKEVQERLLPLWQNQISADLERGRSVLVVSHGNTIRALVKHLEKISDQDIEKVVIHTASPIIYELDGQLTPIERLDLGGNNDLL